MILLTTEIWLDETGAGDGNDLAIDDLSLQEMQQAGNSFVQLNIASANMTATTYELTATPANGQPYSYYWEVCEVDGSGNCLPATQVMNPPQWWVLGANNFKGYSGTSTLAGSNPGLFTIGKKYAIKYGVFGLCTSWTESRWYFSFVYGQSKMRVSSTPEGLANASQ